MTETGVSTEQLLNVAVTNYALAGWQVVSRAPGMAVMKAPPIKLPVATFAMLTLITLGAFLLVWIPLALLPRKLAMVLTVKDGKVVKKRSWNY